MDGQQKLYAEVSERIRNGFSHEPLRRADPEGGPPTWCAELRNRVTGETWRGWYHIGRDGSRVAGRPVMASYLTEAAWRVAAEPQLKLALLALCQSADDECRCAMSTVELAHLVSVSRRQAQRFVRDLIEVGAISSDETGGARGYLLHASKFPAIPAKPGRAYGRAAKRTESAEAIVDATPVAAGDTRDAATRVFTDGLAYLLASGESERGARSFLGLLRRNLGDEGAARLIDEAKQQNVSDPRAWLAARAGEQGKRRNKTRESFENVEYHGTDAEQLPDFLRVA